MIMTTVERMLDVGKVLPTTSRRRRRRKKTKKRCAGTKRRYTPSQILDYFTIDLHSFFSLFFPFSSLLSLLHLRIRPRDNYKEERRRKKKGESERPTSSSSSSSSCLCLFYDIRIIITLLIKNNGNESFLSLCRD